MPALFRLLSPGLVLLSFAVLPAAAAATAAEASRFLIQASFGPTSAEIDRVRSLGYPGWLDQQFARGPTLHRPLLEQSRFLLGLPLPLPDASIEDRELNAALRQEAWWRVAVTADDQLRQRVAFALSEIFVVSDVASQLHERPLVTAEYYDTLLRHAFGNYRELLEAVTLAPAMGLYLSMIRNDKPDPVSGRRPDENYAREVLQLFSIGLWRLRLDGSDLLDGNGQRIPTYDQATVEELARAFTGWTWADAQAWDDYGSSHAPMKAFEEHHDRDAKRMPNGVLTPAGRSAAQDLDQALDAIFQHPNVAPFICRRLIQRLVTSNPSPAYLRRVALVFENNGSGVRGDLRAVVRAILLDSEAREAPGARFGKLREPLLRLTAVWRAFGARAANGRYEYPAPQVDFGQASLRSPSVFNFFQPDFRAPGEVLDAGLYAPELQLQTESQGLAMVNALTRFVRAQHEGSGASGNDTVLIGIEREKTLAADPAALVEHLNTLLLAGRMPAAMRSLLLSHLGSVPLEDGRRRAVEAIFLIATSPQFAVQQ